MSDNSRLRLAIIIGSTRRGRFGPTVARWFTGQARRRRELDVDLIDLAEARLPDTLGDECEELPRPVAALAPRLAAADAFVVVTPEYNRSFPAPLKTAIDWYLDEWKAKPVAFLSYGGPSGGLHAAEQLRSAFTEVHAVTIRDGISIPNYWDEFDADGEWPKTSTSFAASVKATLDQLIWWARLLHHARDVHPYES
ncbi:MULTISPECIES: NAD(P)H-dependent oxidoreductase [unclassified Streptomyces]|uniref:NADPH-dependent FMN reductase n=1 Tax=unclassified Streptomyces TaxID=2593676 RepID=UPI0033A67353